MTTKSILRSICRIKSKPVLQVHHLLTVFFTLHTCNMHVACCAEVPSSMLHLCSRSHTQEISFLQER